MSTPTERLQQWLSDNRITSAQLAAEIGMSYNMVWRVVTGDRAISDAFRWRFGKAYGFDLALTMLEDEPNPRWVIGPGMREVA